MKRINIIFVLSIVFLFGCKPGAPEEISIGFIGPLTGNAVDLGAGPAKAMELAVELYNESRQPNQPKVNFFFEDGKWNGDNAIPLYDKLRKENDIEILLLSHTDGTIALQQKVMDDNVILINSLNNDDQLSELNENTFMIGKKTEEAAQVVAGRIIELGKRDVAGFYVANNFMTTSANALKEHLSKQDIDANMLSVNIDKTNYTAELKSFQEAGCDALVLFGYKNLGFAMKQARDLGMTASCYASTTALGKGYYENAEGEMPGTEIPFFTPNDGNYILANQFLEAYKKKYGSGPFSVWAPMQAYDAMNIVLSIIARRGEKPAGVASHDWLKSQLHDVIFYQGVCGNLAILEDGSSRGIYFSLYSIKGNGIIEKVKR